MISPPRLPGPAALALLLSWACLAQPAILAAQVRASEGVPVRLIAQPERITVRVGESMPFEVRALDAQGREVEAELVVRGSRGGVAVDNGLVFGLDVGEHAVVAAVLPPAGSDMSAPPTVTIPVEVLWPPIARVQVQPERGRPYVGTHVRFEADAFHPDGSRRPGADVRWTSSDPAVATVDRHGLVAAHGEGSVRITAQVEGVEGSWEGTIPAFPPATLEVEVERNFARTGDVLALEARATGSGGGELSDLPIRWSYSWMPHDSIVEPGAAAVVRHDQFMAQFPGTYTIWAQSGPLAAHATVEVESRQVVQRLEVLGQGRVSHRRTSDFWVFEGVDGRDYGITGTWGSDGFAYFWDVTDPTNHVLVDSLQVDARTVNDVKASPDGRYATLTREGASNRRNGVIIIDLADPRRPVLATEYDEGLTGGVHNAYPQDDYLYVLSGGERYLIVDITDIYHPRTVSEVNLPGSRIHDVWVHDGIAYSAEWRTGVVMTDVGNGRWGGSPESPVVVTTYPLPGGNTHAVFPYFQEATGRFYIFAGDEIIGRQGYALEGGNNRAPYDPDVPGSGTPRNTAGYIHIVDFTDPENPRKVARYQVPEYGSHNIWVEDDILYQAYYEGGMRLVDVSGPLMGNLYTQGREIAVFKPNDPMGYVANAPTTWSVMPFKGNIFLSDANSGMWALKLLPPTRLVP
ncbi:MAG: Ig-like domain-containing protein [Gemmatimonadota bacterium]